MFPTLTLQPGRRAELVVLVLAALIALAAAWSARRRSDDARVGALFVAYLAGWSALILLVHAVAMRSPLSVSSYAATLVTGALATWAILFPRLRGMGLPLRLVFSIFLGGLVIGVGGSRLAHMLSELPRVGLVAEWAAEVPRVQDGGLGVFGAFVGNAIFMVVLFRRFPAYSIARVLDASTSAMALGLAIGRSGCVLAGCCYGALTSSDGPWTLPMRVFAPESPAGIAYAGAEDARVWATQPLEAAAFLVIAVASEGLYRTREARRLPDGSVLAFAAGAYGIVRAALEVVRADSLRILGVFTSWQILGLVLFAGASAWALASRRRPSAPTA